MTIADKGTAITPDPSVEVRHAEALSRTAALQRAIFDSATFSSIATDANGVIQIFNVGAERMLGFTADEVVNEITPAQLSDPRELVARATALSVELGTTITPGLEALVFKASRGIEDIHELTYIRKDGSRLPAVVSVTALRDAESTIIGYLLIVTDNTARKQTELLEEIERQKLLVEDASRTKSELLANMSHELRAPLNAIIGFSEVLRDGLLGDLSEAQRAFTSDIFDSGKQLLALINDILDLSRVEAGEMTLDLEPVRITSLFANSLAIVREKAAARKIDVTIDVPEDLGSIHADARKVKQIIYNLLSNAVKFAVDGGDVTLRARRVPRASVGRITGASAARTFPLAASDYGEFLEISVADRGIGISADGIRELFQPFRQIDSALARRCGGSGLGLAMVKALAELHAGSVAVESTEGEGACFTVWLPLRVDEEPTVAPAPRAGVPRPTAGDVVSTSRTPSIALMVEDDAKAADIIRQQLEGLGFTVLHAPSAELALMLAVQHPLALITLDIFLPDMDGWELLDRLKQLAGLKHVPVVIISMAADSTRGFALGAAAVMQKPISRNDLQDLLGGLGLLPAPYGKPIKVLIVDDDPKAVELIAVRMLALATTVLRAYGGREAIALARAELPDLIILDLVMPDVSGFDVVEALDADVATARIPILVVTSFAVSGDERAKLQGHVVAIMEKGQFGHDRFSSEVKRAMSGREVSA